MRVRICQRSGRTPVFAWVVCVIAAAMPVSASHVNYWDSERQIDRRLEYLPGDSENPIAEQPLADRLFHDQSTANGSSLADLSDRSPARQFDPSTFVRSMPLGAAPPIGLIDDVALNAPTAVSGSHGSTALETSAVSQSVAIPLPSGAWSGLACLGGIAGFYVMKNFRRLLR